MASTEEVPVGAPGVGEPEAGPQGGPCSLPRLSEKDEEEPPLDDKEEDPDVGRSGICTRPDELDVVDGADDFDGTLRRREDVDEDEE
jgi:hypothetical protein